MGGKFADKGKKSFFIWLDGWKCQQDVRNADQMSTNEEYGGGEVVGHPPHPTLATSLDGTISSQVISITSKERLSR